MPKKAQGGKKMQKPLPSTTKTEKPNQTQTNPVFDQTESILNEIRLERTRLRILQSQKRDMIALLQNQNDKINHLENKIQQLAQLPAKIKENNTK